MTFIEEKLTVKEIQGLKATINVDLMCENGIYYLMNNNKAHVKIWGSFCIVAIKEACKKLNACRYSFIVYNTCRGMHQYKLHNGTTAMAKHASLPSVINQLIASFGTPLDPTMIGKTFSRLHWRTFASSTCACSVYSRALVSADCRKRW